MTDRVVSTDWRRAPAPPRIRENEIHVWRAQLDAEQALLPGLEAILAPEEKSRAGRFVSPRERAELRLLPPDRRVEGFFLCWTLKEAYIKARSVGLGIPLDSFDVSLMPGQPKGLISPDSDRWTLRSFQPAPGYAGAVVGEGKNWELRYWDWNSGHDFINTATYSAAGRKEISRV